MYCKPPTLSDPVRSIFNLTLKVTYIPVHMVHTRNMYHLKGMGTVPRPFLVVPKYRSHPVQSIVSWYYITKTIIAFDTYMYDINGINWHISNNDTNPKKVGEGGRLTSDLVAIYVDIIRWNPPRRLILYQTLIQSPESSDRVGRRPVKHWSSCTVYVAM